MRSSPRGPRSASKYKTSPTNKSDGSSHVEESVFTPEAISGNTFRRLTTEKSTLATDIDEGKICWNFAWLDENVSVPVAWERKPEEHSVCRRLHRL